MANRLVRLRQISGATSTPDAGTWATQKVYVNINGLVDGRGVAMDASGTIYVSDFDQHVIYKYRKGDTSSKILAGTYGVSGLVDGQAGGARFNKPAALACDKRGFIYVVDSGNDRIRKIDENGNVYTIAAIPAEVVSDEIGGLVVDGDEIFFIDNN
jgi:DNA-binding beta-propeller fold protein YncE